MNRLKIQALLCFILCPLLAAQQVTQETAQQAGAPMPGTVWIYPTLLNGAMYPPELSGLRLIPNGAFLELTALEPTGTANAKVGDAVEFVVTKDLVVGGVTALRAGTLLNCTVTKVRNGIRTNRNGTFRLRVKEVTVGNSVKLRLTDNPNSSAGRRVRRAVTRTTEVIEIAVMLPFFALLLLLGIPILDCKNCGV